MVIPEMVPGYQMEHGRLIRQAGHYVLLWSEDSSDYLVADLMAHYSVRERWHFASEAMALEFIEARKEAKGG